MSANRNWRIFITLTLLLVSCTAPQTPPTPLPTPLPTASPTPVAPPTPILTENEKATLSSLERVDDYPLYTMHYSGPLRGLTELNGTSNLSGVAVFPAQKSEGGTFGCSLFAALGDPENRLYGRNLQADNGPGLLLFTDPPDGYASVSMVNLKWLGLGDRSRNLADLPLAERQMLLFAPAVPFDGMNEKGLAIGMASVDSGG